MTNVCLTFDVDWAPEEVLKYVVEKLTKSNLKATFFATHNSEILKSLDPNLFEIGIHPNFNNFNEDLSFPVKELKQIYPNAIGGRSHSLFCSSKILEIYEKFGLKYESNVFLPYHENLTAVKRRRNLTSIPFFWSDDYCLDNNLIFNKKENILLEMNGLKVFNFHPIHIFANTPSSVYYQNIKEYYQEPKILFQKKNKSEYGIEDIFNKIIGLIIDNNIYSNKMETVLKNESAP